MASTKKTFLVGKGGGGFPKVRRLVKKWALPYSRKRIAGTIEIA